jgi:TNF receptor-associated factor 4
MALAVKCSNAGRGCGWRGTLGTLEKHVATCEFALVPCPNACNQSFARKDLASHLNSKCLNREYECGFCGEKNIYAYITVVHDEICEKKIVPCPNEDCTNTIQRQDVQKHLKACEFTKVACKYARLGCDVKMRRRDIPTHEIEDTLHFHMALDKIITIEEKFEEQVEEITYLRSKTALPFTFKVTSFTKFKKDRRQSVCVSILLHQPQWISHGYRSTS